MGPSRSIELSVRVTVVQLTPDISVLIIIQVMIFILSAPLPMMVMSGKMMVMGLSKTGIRWVTRLLDVGHWSIRMRPGKELGVDVMGPLGK